MKTQTLIILAQEEIHRMYSLQSTTHVQKAGFRKSLRQAQRCVAMQDKSAEERRAKHEEECMYTQVDAIGSQLTLTLKRNLKSTNPRYSWYGSLLVASIISTEFILEQMYLLWMLGVLLDGMTLLFGVQYASYIQHHVLLSVCKKKHQEVIAVQT